VDQVSLPMRIALLAVLAFAGLWLVALRPKPAADPAPAAPAAATAKPATGKSTPAETAKPAAKAAADKTAKAAAADKPAKGDEKVAPAVQSVLDDLEAKKVVVLLFWDRRISDDQEVRRAVAGVNRHGGKVKVHVAPIGKLGDFEPITRGLPVVTSPSTLVIDKTKHARVISGLTITREIDQSVGLALQGK
jgi:hypothetical protein